MSNLSPLPFVPSSLERLETMIELSRITPGQKAADLGSGDGRVVIALAQLGAEAHGYEIDPSLVAKSLQNIKSANLSDKAFIHQEDFFEADLSQYEVLTIYGITSIMRPLEEKLRAELKPGARVISNYFTFPNWEEEEKEGEIYVYRQR